MAKFGGSKMYPRGPMIAHSASNCVADLSIGIDKDFFRSLVSMRTGGTRKQCRNRSLWSRLGRRQADQRDLLHNLDAERLQSQNLARMIGQQADGG
jgi:hypothetical protein